MTFATITLTGKFQDVAQNYLGGTITVVPNFSEAIDAAAEEIFAAIPQVYAIHPSPAGFTTAGLVTSDSTDLVPLGWQYDVTVALTGLPAWSFALLLPSALGSTIDLSQLSPAVPAPPQRQALGGFNVTPSGLSSGTADWGNIDAALGYDGYASLAPGLYYISQPVTPDSRQVVAGFGAGVVIRPGTSWSGSYMAALAKPASTYEVTIRDILFYCGDANGSGVLSGPGGVQLDNTGYANTPGGGVNNPVDPLHTLDNVLVFNAGGDGFHLDNHARGVQVTACKAYRCAGYGFYLGDAGGAGSGCTDSHFTDCVSGFSGNHGFNILNSNNLFTACKAFTAGFNFFTGATGTTQCGFELSGSQCLVNTLTGCSAQQASLHGFDLQSCSNIAITGCQADSNGAGTSGSNGAGININTATYCTITGNAGKQLLTPGAQVYGIQQQAGACTGTWVGMNSVEGTSDTFGYVAGSALYLIDGPTTTNFSGVNEFRVGVLELYPDGIITLTSGYGITVNTEFGSYPVTMAGDVTGVTLSAGPKPGDIITITNTSASYTVTFAASGTSNVAGGTSVVIGALQTLPLQWEGNTSLWYPM